jgi:hypothetical protein
VRSVVVLAFVVSCMPVPVYRVQRTVRVPHPAAPLWSGAPMQGPIELAVGASSVLDTRSPHLHDHDASIEVPSQQFRGEVRFRAHTYGQLVLIHDHAFSSSFHALDPTQAPVREGSAESLGVAARYSFHVPDTPRFTIGLGVEALKWWLPFVEYRSCVANCEGHVTQQMVTGRDTVAMMAFSLVPAYRTGRWTAFAGLYGAPHPTVVRKGTEVGGTYDTTLDRGDMNLLLHAGVELSVRQFSVLVQVQRDMIVDPASYGPSFGFALAGRLPESAALTVH